MNDLSELNNVCEHQQVILNIHIQIQDLHNKSDIDSRGLCGTLGQQGFVWHLWPLGVCATFRASRGVCGTSGQEEFV